MKPKVLTVIRIATLAASLIGTAGGFVVDRFDSKKLGEQLQEMRDIENRMKTFDK